MTIKQMWSKVKRFVRSTYEWHKDATYHMQLKLKLDDYTMWWIAFLKGVVLVLFFQWVFG